MTVNQMPEAGAFDVLGDRTRRKMVATLAERPRPAGELAVLLRITKPAVSRHLRLLRGKGVVEEYRIPQDRRVRMYRLQPAAFDQVSRWADAVRTFWERQLGSFAEVAREDAARAQRASGRKGRHRRRRRRQ